MIFEKFGDFEVYLDVGDYNLGKLKMELIFDKFRREWVQKFFIVDEVKKFVSVDRSIVIVSMSVGFRCEFLFGWVL